MQSLNESFQSIGESPIKKKRLGEGKYSTSNMKIIEKALKTRILNIPENVNSSKVSSSPDAEILKQLKGKISRFSNFKKEKFQDSATSKSLKVTVLTILLKSWSIQKVQEVFPSAANYTIRRAKQLVVDQGIMSSPNPKPGKTLNRVTVEVVKSSYNSDEVSRVLPVKKGYVSIKVIGVKIHEQKRLLLYSLKELYSHFKNSHPGVKVGFSKFASLHPRNCVMAGASGTVSVCVCTICQNVKLMLEACKISELTRSSEQQHLCTYQHSLNCDLQSTSDKLFFL
jgi:hypothetical protein